MSPGGSTKTAPSYQLKITLDDIHPPVVRRFLVSSNITLRKLHDVIQIVMGWQDYHLHMFTIDGQIYGDPEDDEFGDLGTLDELEYRLRKVVLREGQQFHYEYDFGDSWRHTLRLEKILPLESKTRLPVCLMGKRACPPEDVGGVWGYAHFLEALSDPTHDEREEYLIWVGGQFDPQAFDLEQVNRRLDHLKRTPNAPNTWPTEERPFDLQDEPHSTPWVTLLNEEHRRALETLPLRRDVLTLLDYIKATRVTGTQSTGNLPLKAVQAISAQFVVPPKLEETIGDHVYRVRSEVEVWPLYFVHVLATVGGLATGGPGRRWQVTPIGEKFLVAPAGMQVWLLFQTWWRRVNWGIAARYAPDNFPPTHIRQIIREHLLSLPLESPSPFEPFADRLIQTAGLTWPYGDGSSSRTILHGLIELTIVRPLSDFGILELAYEPHRTLGSHFRQLNTLTLTALGKRLLEYSKE